MKHIIIILLTLSLALYTKAQDTCAKFDWANTLISPYENWGFGIAADAAGNTYSTGYFIHTATFGGITLSSTGKQDMYVVKTAHDGQYEWAAKAGGNNVSSVVYGNGVATDAAGNCYVSGYFFGTVTFGSTTLTNASGPNGCLYIAKLDPQGQFLWAIKTDFASTTEGSNSLIVDAQGNCYVYGRLLGTATFGSTTLTPSQQNHIYVAKINTQGQYEWGVNVVGHTNNNSTHPNGISLDPWGNLFIIGSFLHDTAIIGNQVLTPGHGRHIYIAKLDPQGQVLWATYAIGGFAAAPSALRLDNHTDIYGNCYITGVYIDTVQFGNITLVPSPSKPQTAFVAKIDPNGQFMAAIKVGNNNVPLSSSASGGITTDVSGNCYFAGVYNGTAVFGNTVLDSMGIFVAKLDPLELEFEWVVSTKGRSTQTGSWDITADSAGNCYITGNYRDTLIFGNTTLINTSGKRNMYIAKVSADCPTSIYQLANNSTMGLKAYPNPVQDKGLTIVLNEAYRNDDLELNIYDITGRKLYNLKGKIDELNRYLKSITTNEIKGLWTVQLISLTSGKMESIRIK